MVESFPAMHYENRMDNVRRRAELREGRACYLSAISNIRYLTGFTGSAGLLVVHANSAQLVVDGRYVERASAEVSVPGVEIVPTESGRQADTVASVLAGVSAVVVDPSQVTVDVHEQLRAAASGTMVHLRGIPEQLRLTKEEGELARIRKAAEIASRAFDATLPLLETEPAEREFAAALEAKMLDFGADAVGFSTIVASGVHSSKPHMDPTDRKIREGEPVIVDFGATVDGYHSDIARTVWFGDLRPPVKPLYAAAEAALEAGIEAAVVGVSHADVDTRCRRAMVRSGHHEAPLHPSGHNVGLDVHERPYLSQYATDSIGGSFVLSIEPGVYVPGVGGCRIEDMVVTSESGPKVLSRFD